MRRTAGRAGLATVLLLALLGAALLTTYWLGGGAVGANAGDPTSTGPNGAAAVAAVLRDRGGVAVRVAPTTRDLAEPTGTLLVATRTPLSPTALRRLSAAARSADTVVLLRPDGRVLAALAPGVRREGTADGDLIASCATDLADPRDRISGPADLYRVSPARGSQCFTDPLVEPHAGESLPGALVSSVGPSGQERIVLGSSAILTNEQLTKADHAAVALRVLGRHDRLTWYTGALEPAEEAAPEDAPPWPPIWLGPLTLALVGTTLALMLWRGRRLGRLVSEPLPVVVRADETTLARSRLYRRAKDPAHAAGILQLATTRRLAGLLRLSPGADRSTVAAAVARATGRAPAEVHTQLTRAPRDEAELAELTRTLTILEGEVRRP